MALPENKTDICVLSLSRIGSKTVSEDEINDNSGVTAPHCNRNYEQTRDALLRSHWWRFASTRAELEEDEDFDSDEWDNAYDLPDDFLRMKSIYDENEPNHIYKNPYALEGSQLLINADECEIRYIKQVTDVTLFDPLFVEVLVLSLALKLVMPLSQDRELYAEIKDELYKEVMPKVRALDRQETNTEGRAGKLTWNESRY